MAAVGAADKQNEDIEVIEACDIGSFTDLARRPRPDEAEPSDHETTFTRCGVMPDQEALKLIELQQIIKSQNETVIRLEEENARLRKALGAYENGSKNTKKRKLEGVTDNEECTHLKKQVENLSERLNERENELHEAWEKLAESEWTEQPSPKNTPISTSSAENMIGSIQESLDARFKLLQDTLTAAIDDKIKNENSNESARRSYTDAVSAGAQKPQAFHNVMLTTRNEEIVEEKDKAARASNLIIHGVDEGGDESDTTFVRTLIDVVGANSVQHKSLSRIGRKSSTSTKRPIIINFKSESDKDKVFENLNKLKGNETYRRINVTDDYTIPERKLVKEMKEQTKLKNSLEPDNSEHVWKLRGCPKNGLQIRRFRKTY